MCIRDRVRLEGVDHVGKLNGVPDEKHRQAVPYQVKVALAGVKFGGKASGVSDGVRASPAADDSGEPDEHRCPLALFLQKGGAGVGRGHPIGFKLPERPGPFCICLLYTSRCV